MGVIRKDMPAFVCTWGKNQNEFGISVFEQPDFDHSPPEIARVIMEPKELICLAKELVELANLKIDGEHFEIESNLVHPSLD